MEFKEFLELIGAYDNINFDEVFQEELYVITVKCGDVEILKHSFIKCDCETEEAVRNFAYPRVAEMLFEMGIRAINEKCGKNKKKD